MRIAVNVDGHDHVVEFDGNPTEADIEDAASSIRSSMSRPPQSLAGAPLAPLSPVGGQVVPIAGAPSSAPSILAAPGTQAQNRARMAQGSVRTVGQATPQQVAAVPNALAAVAQRIQPHALAGPTPLQQIQGTAAHDNANPVATRQAIVSKQPIHVFNGQKYHGDPFESLPMTQADFETMVDQDLSGVVLKDGRTMPRGQALALVSKTTGQRDFKPTQSYNSDAAQERQIANQATDRAQHGMLGRVIEAGRSGDPQAAKTALGMGLVGAGASQVYRGAGGIADAVTGNSIAQTLAKATDKEGNPLSQSQKQELMALFGQAAVQAASLGGGAAAGLVGKVAAGAGHALNAIGHADLALGAAQSGSTALDPTRSDEERKGAALSAGFMLALANAGGIAHLAGMSAGKMRGAVENLANAIRGSKTPEEAVAAVTQRWKLSPVEATHIVQAAEEHLPGVTWANDISPDGTPIQTVRPRPKATSAAEQAAAKAKEAALTAEKAPSPQQSTDDPRAKAAEPAHPPTVESAHEGAVNTHNPAESPDGTGNPEPVRTNNVAGTTQKTAEVQGADPLGQVNTEPKPGETTSLTVAQRQKEAETLGTAEPKAVKQLSNEEAHAKGKAAVQAGEVDPYALARQLADDNRAAKPEEFGAMLEGHRRLLADINRTQAAVDAAVGTEGHAEASAAYEAAKARAAEFSDHIDKIKGAAGGSLQSLKIGTTVDEGDFAAVLSEARRKKGADLTPKEESSLKAQVEALTREIEGHKSENARVSAENEVLSKKMAEAEVNRLTKQPVKRTRDVIRADREEAVKAFGKATLEASARASSGLPVSVEQLRALNRIARTYVEEGALTLEETVAKVQSFLKERGVTGVEDRHIHDAIAGLFPPRKAAEASPVAARIKDVTQQATEQALQDRLKNGELDYFEQRTKARREGMEKREAAKSAEQKRREDRISFMRSQIRRAIEAKKPKTAGQKVGAFVKDVANIPRTLKTTFDLSAPLRQGLILSVAHPTYAAKAMGAQIKAFRDPVFAHAANQAILESPNAHLYKKAGLYLSDFTGEVSSHEEAFLSKLAGKIPGVAGSERAYTTYLNTLRASTFDGLTAGKNMHEADLKAIANFVNVATGRGNLGGFEHSANGLAQVLFSPRYLTSRFQLLTLQPLYKGGGAVSAQTRGLIAKDLAKYATAVAGVLTLAKGAGAEVSTDPTSSDYLKIKMGDTRIDIGAGLQQAAVFLARMAYGKRTSTSGNVTDLADGGFGKSTRLDLAKDFVRSKLNPAAGYVANWADGGKDMVGNKMDNANTAKDFFTPLIANDFYESMQVQGVPKGLALGIGSLLGLSISNQPKKGHQPPQMFDYLRSVSYGK